MSVITIGHNQVQPVRPVLKFPRPLARKHRSFDGARLRKGVAAAAKKGRLERDTWLLVRGAKEKSGNVQGIRIHIICTYIYIYIYVFIFTYISVQYISTYTTNLSRKIE